MVSWPTVPLGEVINLQRRWVKPVANEEYREIGVRSFGNGIFHKEPVTGLALGDKRVLRIEPGDLVFNNVFAWEGAVAVASESERGMIGSHRFVTYTVDPARGTAEYLKLFFATPTGKEYLLKASPGSAGRNKTLGLERFIAQSIPLPPVAEQRRIVGRVDAIAGRLAEARRLRTEVEGEAESLIYSARHAALDAVARSHPSVRLGDLCHKITDGPHVSPSYVEDGVPFFSVRNITESGLDFTTAKYVTQADHDEYSRKAKVERGDVLYTKGGTTGVARRVDTDREFSIWVHVALLKLKDDLASDGFIEHMLNSPQCRDQAEAKTRGSTNRDLGLTRMANITFPVPPAADQRRIVAHLDAVQAKADALRSLQATTAAELDALLPAVLADAFAGRL